ncbi:signal transduction histidine kinase [Neomicrococcus aestuarii]|uniref:histidine kinase n=1 Tax=Neomicrococcus aestuarii TaxID=556325 RepID=A0A7W8TTC0_9MICC|nr:histidine kinase [Neomicrococcus aestuarii]MBB5512552.1 signal transduction histidine kinase [Neomicrococcus aestuarii]
MDSSSFFQTAYHALSNAVREFFRARKVDKFTLSIVSIIVVAYTATDIVTLFVEQDPDIRSRTSNSANAALVFLAATGFMWIRSTVAGVIAMSGLALSLTIHEYSYAIIVTPLIFAVLVATANRIFIGAFVAACAAWSIGIWSTWPDDRPILYFSIPLLAVGALIGTLIRRGWNTQARHDAELEEMRIRQIEASSAERLSIARDLHDIVAHDITIIAMQAQAASFSKNPELAKQSLEVIGQSARNTLQDLRLLLNVLKSSEEAHFSDKSLTHEEESAATGASTLTLRRSIDQASRQLESIGFRVIEKTSGDLDALPRRIQVAMHRILKEATTNILKHAAPESSCTLCVEVVDGNVLLKIENQKARATNGNGSFSTKSPSAGLGLGSISDRTSSLGGKLDVIQTNSTWRLEVTVPIRGIEL